MNARCQRGFPFRVYLFIGTILCLYVLRVPINLILSYLILLFLLVERVVVVVVVVVVEVVVVVVV